MKIRHFAIPAVAVSLAALGFSSCNKGGGDTIKIGEFASLPAMEAAFGSSSHEDRLRAIE